METWRKKYVDQMKTEKWFFMRYIWRLYFYPSKFDNFKDEKKSNYKIVSDELLLRHFFYVFFKYCSVRTKKLHKMKLKNVFFYTWKKKYLI